MCIRDRLSEAYTYGFAVACISLILSMAIYVCCRSMFKHADYNSKQAKAVNNYNEPELTPAQTKEQMCIRDRYYIAFFAFYFALKNDENLFRIGWALCLPLVDRKRVV